MKLIKYMGVALAMTAFASCSNEDELSFSSWENDPSAVHFQATVGNGLLARTNPGATDKTNQTKFNKGDQISVKAGTQNAVIYTLADGKTWTPVEGNYLKWGKAENMDFEAYYPVTEGTSMAEFTIPTDQSSPEKIAKADYMTFTGNNIAKGDKVILTFERKIARIMVKLIFNSEFAGNTPSVTELKIKGYNQIPNSSSSNLTYFTACKVEGAEVPTYAALVAPNSNPSDNTFFIGLKVNGKKFSIKGLPAVVAGNSYTYNLTVGKERVEVESVSVDKWIDGAVIEGGMIPIRNVLVNQKTHTITTKKAGNITRAQIEEAAGTSSKLVVTGPINGADMKLIREATGCKPDNTEGGTAIVTDLNLKDAQIFASGDEYANDGTSHTITENNHISRNMFKYSALTKLVLPSTTKIIESSAFGETGSLSSVTLPEGLTEIQYGAFLGCGIQSITFPSSLTTLGKDMFASAGNLTSVIFKEGIQLTEIPEGCFTSASKLSSIDIPSSVTTIGHYAFYETPLKELTIPETVTNISSEILLNNGDITSITILGVKGNRTFDDNMFAGMSSTNCTLMLDPSWMEGNSTKTFKGHEFQNIITDDITVDSLTNTIITQKPGLITPEFITQARNRTANLVVRGPINGTDIKAIREAAGCTYNCDNTGIATVTHLDLSGALIKAGGEVYCKYNGYDYTVRKDNILVIAMFNSSKLVEIVVPSTVTAFSDVAFTKSKSLKSCNIPQGVQLLGEKCFECCEQLNNITLPATLKNWRSNCFDNCRALSNFTMEEGIQITTIPHLCFNYNSFTEFTIPESVTKIEFASFCSLKKLKTFTISANVTTIEYNMFSDSKLQTLNIEGPKDNRNFTSACFLSMEINLLFLDISWKDDVTSQTTVDGKLQGDFKRAHCNEIVFTVDGTPVPTPSPDPVQP